MTALVLALALRLASTVPAPACTGECHDIVIRASDISQSSLNGTWTLASDSTSPDGIKLATAGHEQAGVDTAVDEPSDYFDVTFTARAGTRYRLWVRLRALDDSPAGDAIWVQFSDAQADGRPAYRIGSRDALLVKLESCSNCGNSGWGWQDSSWELRQPSTVTFESNGRHSLRVLVAGEGVQIDQLVLSPGAYLEHPPGLLRDDVTVVRRQ